MCLFRILISEYLFPSENRNGCVAFAFLRARLIFILRILTTASDFSEDKALTSWDFVCSVWPLVLHYDTENPDLDKKFLKLPSPLYHDNARPEKWQAEQKKSLSAPENVSRKKDKKADGDLRESRIEHLLFFGFISSNNCLLFGAENIFIPWFICHLSNCLSIREPRSGRKCSTVFFVRAFNYLIHRNIVCKQN